jgi:ABC-type transport system involved in multi-copper enzyme maturation permease subunit
MAKLSGPGPVFTFELLTTSRRWQVYAARSVFVAGLLAGLGLVWWANVAGRSLESIREQAAVGRRFYQALAATQLALALLAAPAATAGAVCLDRSRGSLAHVLVTDLTAAEIVLGKLAARLVPVVGMVLCGVPFLALGTLLGGIDPVSVLGLLLVTLGAAVLGCSLALTLSIWGTRLTEVVLSTYAVWLVVTLLPPSWWVLRRLGGAPWPLPPWMEATSPVLIVFAPTLTPSAATLGEPARFLVLCLALSAVLAAVAAARLRPSAAKEPDPSRRSAGLRLLRRVLPGPSLDGNPVLWREWQVRRPSRWGLVLWWLYAALAVACTGAAAWFTTSAAPGRWVAGSFLNALQVAAGMLLLSISAASTLAEERVRGSLDVLLATPLPTRSIVWGKWWGTFRAVPLLALAPGLATAAIAYRHGHWSAVVLVVGLVVAYGAALTSIGLALATWVPRLSRAVGLCVAAHVGITVGWVVFAIIMTPGTPGLTGPGLASFSPFLGVMLPSLEMQFNRPSGSNWDEVVGWLAFWTLVDAALAAVLLRAVLVTFNHCLGRVEEIPVPDVRVSPWRQRGTTPAAAHAGIGRSP